MLASYVNYRVEHVHREANIHTLAKSSKDDIYDSYVWDEIPSIQYRKWSSPWSIRLFVIYWLYFQKLKNKLIK